MKNFAEFVKANREKIYALAEKNTKRNEAGHTVISRDDPWFYDDVWDEDYKELIARENDSIESDSTARSVVC